MNDFISKEELIKAINNISLCKSVKFIYVATDLEVKRYIKVKLPYKSK